MARRRYQRGTLFLRGHRDKVWVARWREDVLLPDGSVRRVRKCEIIGTLKEYKTRRLAERALERRLSDVNSVMYKPRPTATFAEFAERWRKDVLSQHKRSTQAADRSRIKRHLVPYFGLMFMKDITRAHVQTFVASKAEKVSAKSVRNMVGLLREMWVQAKADGYSSQDVFFGLVLPETGLLNERFLTLDEMRSVIEKANEPYKTAFWILAETGIRAGELCGLPVENLLLDIGAVKISQTVWHGKIQTTKSKRGNRLCEISPQLVEHLRGYLRTWRPNRFNLVFTTRNGTPWDQDVVRKRKLYPLLEELTIKKCGYHAFRHGNETVMDREDVPIAVRLTRLGHSDPRMTMRYTHVVSEDGRKIAARFGELLAPSSMVTMPAGTA